MSSTVNNTTKNNDTSKTTNKSGEDPNNTLQPGSKNPLTDIGNQKPLKEGEMRDENGKKTKYILGENDVLEGYEIDPVDGKRRKRVLVRKDVVKVLTNEEVDEIKEAFALFDKD